MSIRRDAENLNTPHAKDAPIFEIRYRRFFESAFDGILILESDTGTIIDVNASALRLLGVEREEFVGKKLWEIGLFKDEEDGRRIFLEIQSVGAARYDDLPLKTKNGEWRRFEIFADVFPEAESRTIQFNIREHSKHSRLRGAGAIAPNAEPDSEQARLRFIFDHAPIFIVTMRGAEFVIETANPASHQVFGRHELLGVSARAVFPEFEEQGIFDLFNQIYETGEPFTGEAALEIQSGGGEREPRYLNVVCTPLRAADETVSGILVCGGDVTEQVSARKAVQESEAAYRFLFEKNPLPMWVFDVETFAFLSVNDAAIKQYGYTREEFAGMTLRDIRLPEDVPILLEDIKKDFAGIGRAGIRRHKKKDGTLIYVEIISSRLKFGGRKAELVTANDVTERRKTVEALRQTENNYRNLIESSPGIVYLNEPNPPYKNIYVSPNVRLTGYTQEDWHAEPNMWANLIHPKDRDEIVRRFNAAASRGLETDFEYRIIDRNGKICWWHDKGRFVLDDEGNRTGWQGLILDITATKELEEQLRQSQKLESVGRLAGGIAHDFNNMLTAINGYSELTLRRLEADDPLRRNIEEIKKAGLRSADLTRQLLAFSRQQVLQSIVIELNQIITDTTNLLQRLIGEDIQLTTALNPKAGRVKVDPGKFSQIILNLAVNARDAMPNGGKLSIETANVFLDPDYVSQYVGFLPGAYVLMAVTDNGSGMSGEIQKQIFEPFFTTKEVGRGTGLGLATVYGIVKQSGGNIEVFSEPGVGTTFKIYLPRVAERVEEAYSGDDAADFLHGDETILLVEDEELVRNLTREILETCGYTVIEARDGTEALEICERGECQFDLLMTDVVMPQMNGRELAEKLAVKVPELSILFTSGYTSDAILRRGVMEVNTNFIQKPFTFDALASKIREMLDAKTSKDAA